MSILKFLLNLFMCIFLFLGILIFAIQRSLCWPVLLISFPTDARDIFYFFPVFWGILNRAKLGRKQLPGLEGATNLPLKGSGAPKSSTNFVFLFTF